MRILVLFNLKPGCDAAAYEAWARQRDLPHVRALPSVVDFQIYRVTGLFGSDEPPPYRYAEVIDIRHMEPFLADVSSEAMKAVAAEFQDWAERPVFMLTEAIG